MNPKISGALYDFMAYLTTTPDNFTVGSTATSYELMSAFETWARERGYDLQKIKEPDLDWYKSDSVGEQLISLVEFYSVGAMPMGDVGSVGTSDGGPGRKDDTDFDKRRRWLDAKEDEGAWSNDGSGSERDIDATVNVDRVNLKRRFEKLYQRRPDLAREDFGLAGLPGGVRNDLESPNAYDDTVQARLK